MAAITPVLLSGGAGTRLWPMSRHFRPKQLLPLTGHRTMLEETASRVVGPAFAPPVVVCNEDHRFMIAEQMRAAGIAPAAIMLEPVARNTAPAIAAAAVWLAEHDPNALMLVLPSDHVIADVPGFLRAVETAAAAARSGCLVTFGVTPTRPETGYGYIRRGAPLPGLDGCYAIDAFVEKPDAATAAAYVASGTYAWNSGMFVIPAAGFLEELERLQPAIVDGCRRAVAGAREDRDFLRLARGPFEGIPSVSADAAVMEATDRGAVVPVDIGWNDIGAWSALWDIGDHDADGNVTAGDVITQDVQGCYLRGENNLVAALGVRDLVIVATDDVVLVVPRNRSQDVKALVERIEAAGRTKHKSNIGSRGIT